MRRVLVLKGGGVRGVLQLAALELLENHFNKKICEIFDLIVGTSVGSITGGILATGLIPMNKYYDLFLRNIPKVFQRRRGLGLLKPIYRRSNFYRMWYDFFPNNRNLTMAECKTRFLCTSVNLTDFRTHFFKSWDPNDGKENLMRTITKSFAAPYYFGAMVEKKTRSVWVDGGAGASNTPLQIAYAESINLGWYRTNVEYTVLGTGTVDNSIPYEKASKINTLKQIMAFLNPREGGLARIQSTINQLDQLSIIAKAEPLVSLKYYDIDIGKEYDGMAKLKNMVQYQGFGRLIAEKLRKDLIEEERLIPQI